MSGKRARTSSVAEEVAAVLEGQRGHKHLRMILPACSTGDQQSSDQSLEPQLVRQRGNNNSTTNAKSVVISNFGLGGSPPVEFWKRKASTRSIQLRTHRLLLYRRLVQ